MATTETIKIKGIVKSIQNYGLFVQQDKSFNEVVKDFKEINKIEGANQIFAPSQEVTTDFKIGDYVECCLVCFYKRNKQTKEITKNLQCKELIKLQKVEVKKDPEEEEEEEAEEVYSETQKRVIRKQRRISASLRKAKKEALKRNVDKDICKKPNYSYEEEEDYSSYLGEGWKDLLEEEEEDYEE